MLLLPVLSIGLVVCLVFSWWLHVSFYNASVEILLMVQLLTGYTSFIVLGSAFDLDRSQVAEGTLQTLMLEELPVTPRRLQLLGLSLMLLTGMVLLIVKLPIVVAIFTLMLLDGVVYIGLGKPCLARVSSTKV
jgi:hypothetical protein